jgi:trimeric autotransporter adhesin
MESPDGTASYAQVGADLVAVGFYNHVAPLHKRIGAKYFLRACVGVNCADSNVVSVTGTLSAAIGYIKASNTESFDNFGYSVALSSDGNTLAVAAVSEDSNASIINGNQADNSLISSGAVYVFVRDANSWLQQAYVKPSNPDSNDRFGESLALSNDGNILAVGATYEDSNAQGIGGTQANNSATDSGAAYVFTRSGTTWTQQAYIKASNSEAQDQFGAQLALSGDGSTLAIAARGEDSAATGIGGSQSDNSSTSSGAVYVFKNSGSAWSQQAYIKAASTSNNLNFGSAVAGVASSNSRVGRALALTNDGNYLAVGVALDDTSAGNAGAVYVFFRQGATWSQQYFATSSDVADNFGVSVALSADGATLAVGISSDDSNATTINGDPINNLRSESGAVYVLTRNGTTWSQQAYIKASDAGTNDLLGSSVVLSSDGNTLAVAATGEDGGAGGSPIVGDNNFFNESGSVYVFTRSGSSWQQQSRVHTPNGKLQEGVGDAIALSGDGDTLVIGNFTEDSATTGINGDVINSDAQNAGAVFVY